MGWEMWIYVGGLVIYVAGVVALMINGRRTRRVVVNYFDASTHRVNSLGKSVGALKIDYDSVAQLDERVRRLEQQLTGPGQL